MRVIDISSEGAQGLEFDKFSYLKYIRINLIYLHYGARDYNGDKANGT